MQGDGKAGAVRGAGGGPEGAAVAGDTAPGAARLKRLRIRAWRRGIRECDLLLGGWADAHLARCAPATLDAFEALLEENDHDIYAWIAGTAPAPAVHAPVVERISRSMSDAAKAREI